MTNLNNLSREEKDNLVAVFQWLIEEDKKQKEKPKVLNKKNMTVKDGVGREVTL